MSAEQIAKDVLGKLEAAWNGGDGASYGSVFAEDAYFVDIRGTRHRGRAAIAEGHQGIFNSIYKGSKIHEHLIDVTQLSDDVLVVHAASDLDCPVGPLAGKNSSTQTAILKRVGNDFRVASFHNTLVMK